MDLEHISVENALFSRGKITLLLHQDHKEEEKVEMSAGFEPLKPEVKQKRKRNRRSGGTIVGLLAGLVLGYRTVS